MMKYILILVLLPIGIFAQNLKDAYDDHTGQFHFSQDDQIVDYNGEYQIFLDKMY
ncbi:MAG: hypothetical protein U9R60_16200 [Bacteroidota bacterium]|nr:hypothetical protein [Bacteroidota bacterium]